MEDRKDLLMGNHKIVGVVYIGYSACNVQDLFVIPDDRARTISDYFKSSQRKRRRTCTHQNT